MQRGRNVLGCELCNELGLQPSADKHCDIAHTSRACMHAAVMEVVPFVSYWPSNLFKKEFYKQPLFGPQMIINSFLKSPIKWDNHKCITSHIERVGEQMGLLPYFIGWIYGLSLGHLGPRIFMVNCLVLLASILCRKSKSHAAPALQLGLALASGERDVHFSAGSKSKASLGQVWVPSPHICPQWSRRACLDSIMLFAYLGFKSARDIECFTLLYHVQEAQVGFSP